MFLLLALFNLVLFTFLNKQPIFITSSDSESESNSAETPPKKKTKYSCVYLRKWKEQYSWAASLARVIPTADNILAQKGMNERKEM
jgi:hypothetical protein